MNNVRLTKKFSFETAHALYGYDGKCRHIHGHSYYLYVTILGKPIDDSQNCKYGMVMDFGDLKSIIEEHIIQKLDHAILLNKNSPHLSLGELLLDQGHQVVFVDYQPTCENMIVDFANTILSVLPASITLEELKLYETENSYSQWIRSDQ